MILQTSLVVPIYGANVLLDLEVEYQRHKIRPATRWEPEEGGVELIEIKANINGEWVSLPAWPDSIADDIYREIYEEHKGYEEDKA